uniref:PID domain-containing protein n=1 Tax=Romanomermis culicivorax TaxID=13658 RepID=A0A915KIV6_ROMCU
RQKKKKHRQFFCSDRGIFFLIPNKKIIVKVQVMTALFGRKKKLIINEPDPEYQVIYLGNVLTPIAKNELDKPLALIWRTYSSHTRPDLPMALKVTAAGLKARTKQQGLTEYWAHRILAVISQKYPPKFIH